jgi:isocitrate dehydrogenase
VPDYPEEPKTEAEKAVRARYDAIKGFGGEPGPARGQLGPARGRAVKAYRAGEPAFDGHGLGRKTRVSSMTGTTSLPTSAPPPSPPRRPGRRGSNWWEDGSVKVLKDGRQVDEGTVVDATFMSARALRAFLAAEMEATRKREGVLFSMHLKATMMKVSDPIIFGHAVSVWLKDGPRRTRDARRARVQPQLGDRRSGSADRRCPSRSGGSCRRI